MKGYSKDDVRIARMARRFRAGAAICVFALVGAVWLPAQVVADRWMTDSITAGASTVSASDESPDAENPSSVPTTY